MPSLLSAFNCPLEMTAIEMKNTDIGNTRIYKWTNTHLNQVYLFAYKVHGLGEVTSPL